MKKGADVNVVNNIGHSPLYHAASRADEKFMNLIIKSGCNLSLECWIRHQMFPVAIKENLYLKNYLLQLIRNPPTLQNCVNLKIRDVLKHDFCEKVSLLPIPIALQNVISLNNI